MISSGNDKIEHFRGGGGGRSSGSFGGGGRSSGSFGGGGISRNYGSVHRSNMGGDFNYNKNVVNSINYRGLARNNNIGYKGNYYGGGDNYGWNNYPLIYNNYIPIDSDDYDNNNDLISSKTTEVTEKFNNNSDNDNNKINVIWYLISFLLILFILTRKQ